MPCFGEGHCWLLALCKGILQLVQIVHVIKQGASLWAHAAATGWFPHCLSVTAVGPYSMLDSIPARRQQRAALLISVQETWEAMEAIHAKGLARNIGVSNWSIKKTEDMLKYAKVVPAVNQVSPALAGVPWNGAAQTMLHCGAAGVCPCSWAGPPDDPPGVAELPVRH